MTPLASLPDVRPFAEIARGPVASVYKALDGATGETVLLKALRPATAADPERRARFAEEARLAATVSHPNVVRVRVATDDALVADWVEGADARATLDAHGALPPALAAYVGREAARGLAAIHAAGILHRDVKPANVLLASDGDVRLTDFGLASLAPDADAPAGEVRGSLAQLAPEVVQGTPASAAADVFALGAVLVELLTGRAPFAGATASDTLDAVLHADATAALAADPRVPPALAALAADLLARDPAARPTAAGAADRLNALGPAAGADLAVWLADPHALPPPALATPDAAPTVTAADRPAASGRPSRRRVAALAGVALLAAAALFAATRSADDPRPTAYAPPTGRDGPAPVVLPPADSLAPADGAPQAVVPSDPVGDAAPVELPSASPSLVETTPEPRPSVSEPAAPAPAPAEPTVDRPTPAAPGTLVVVAEPWATVRVDGRAIGTTPVAPLTLPAGTYTVAFENPAFPPHSVTVRVGPGETARAEVSLWRLVARVTLDVAPWAEVWVDGRRWGTVPPQDRPLLLTPGAHTLAFVHPSLGRRELTLRVAAGEERTVRVRLTDPTS